MHTGNTPRRQPGKKKRTFRQVTGVWQDEELLPFAVPDLDRDVEKGMCITVEMGAAVNEPYVPEIYQVTCEYIEDVCELIEAGLKGNRKAWLLAQRRLEFPEVPEIRFGYVRDGHDGHGIGKRRVSRRVFDFMSSYRQLRETCMVHPDAIQIIPLLGMDRVSDAMANISKEILIKFTQYCAKMFAFNDDCMKLVTVAHVWIRADGVYRDVRAVLPTDDDGNPILLVPKRIVRSGPAFTPSGYVEGIPPSKPGSASKAQDTMSKQDVLDDAELHPGRLSGYTETRIKKVGPRREFRRPEEKRKRKKK